MSSDFVLDFERLLTPIPGENVAGVDLRADTSSIFYEIRETQRQARQIEKPKPFESGGNSTDASAQWKQISELGQKTLAEESKDLQVAAWVIEALARSDGFAGLRDGFRLTRELVERFWDDLYPRPDEEGVTTTVWPLTGLSGEDTEGPLIKAIRRIPITAGQEYGPYPLWRLRQADELDLAEPDKRQQRIENDGAITREMFDRSVRETPPEFFRNLLDDITGAKTEFAQLESLLEEKCGEDENGFPLTPSTAFIRKVVDECLEAALSISKDILGETDSLVEAGDSGGTSAGESGARAPAPVGAINSRDSAFRTLKEVAKFFRQAEPHSPIPYAIEQVVRWGQMSLPELLSELIPDESARDAMFKQVGISDPSGSSEE